MDIAQLTIDREFSSCQRRHSPDEFAMLEKNILADGRVTDPIIIWKGTTIVVDGEHRKRVVDKHPQVPFAVEEMEFENRAEVMAWICNRQLGRRNLDGLAMTTLRAKALKEVGDTNEVASMFSVTPRTIQRDAETAKAVEALPQELQERLNNGELVATPTEIRKFGSLNATEQTKITSELMEDRSKKMKDALPAERKKHTLTDEDMGVVAETFSPSVKKKIALGGIAATHSDIQRVAKLDPVLKETVDDVLLTGEVSSVSEALDNINIAKKPKKPPTVDVDALKNKASDLICKAVRAVDDLSRATGKPAKACVDYLKLADSNLPC